MIEVNGVRLKPCPFCGEELIKNNGYARHKKENEMPKGKSCFFLESSFAGEECPFSVKLKYDSDIWDQRIAPKEDSGITLNYEDMSILDLFCLLGQFEYQEDYVRAKEIKEVIQKRKGEMK